MKIVIDIEDWRYKSICEGVEASKRCGVIDPDPVIHEAIANGIVLPKGHGYLIDRDDIARAILPLIDTETRIYVTKNLYTVPTIIEADKGE